MKSKTKVRSKIRTGVRSGHSTMNYESEVLNNPLYCGNGCEGTNPLFNI